MLDVGNLYGEDINGDELQEDQEEDPPKKSSPLNSSVKIFARLDEAQKEVLHSIHRDIRRDSRYDLTNEKCPSRAR